jgi:hypothetical protein
MTKRRIYFALALVPLFLILIPAFLGYFLYSPINNGWIQIGWFGLFTWLWWQETKKAEELESFIFQRIVLGFVGLFLVFGYGTANLGAQMEQVIVQDISSSYEGETLVERKFYCEPITYYTSPSIEGGIMNMLGYGGGRFIDSFVTFYKSNRVDSFFNSQEVCIER